MNQRTTSYLLIELDGDNKENLILESEKIYNILQGYKCDGEYYLLKLKMSKKKIWKVRRSIGLAVKAFSIYKEEDTVVQGELAGLLNSVKKIGKRYNFKSV